jgi:hypothetical protein
MSNDRLNDLLQEWAAARIRFSSKQGRRPERLGKILDRISEVECERQPPSLERALPAEEPRTGRTLRKGPARVGSKREDKSRRGNFA